MKKVYFIEKRCYTLDKDEPIGQDYRRLGHCAYSSFEVAHKAFEQIKGLQGRKYQYIPEVGDCCSYYGKVKYPELNMLEKCEIISFELVEA